MTSTSSAVTSASCTTGTLVRARLSTLGGRGLIFFSLEAQETFAMPLLRKQPFSRKAPAKDLRPEDEVFLCEATKEVFRDYDEFFQRTILCNSLVWSCSVTGKANLTYEEAVECERKARKRLLAMPRPLKRALFHLAGRTRRGRMADLVDDVYVFAYNRFFVGEIVEAVIKDQWCDCKILRVIPPTQEEVDKDAAEEAEEAEKERKEAAEKGEPSPKRSKDKKSFSPPDHLFRYEVVEVEPDNPEVNEIVIVDAEDVRREKGTYTREKNLLFLKNLVEMGKDGNNFTVKEELRAKYAETTFEQIFSGPVPAFEETKRLKGLGSQSSLHTAKRKMDDKKKRQQQQGKKQGTLDGWVKGDKGSSSGAPKGKKQTAAELEAEMKRMREQNARFKEEMKKRAEEAKRKRLEDKAKEKERKKEEKKLLGELMSEWKKVREDLECEDLKEMPRPRPVHCGIPNQLFGDFLVILEFMHNFSELLEVENSFSHGLTFEILENALTDCSGVNNNMYEILQFFLGVLFDLQEEEDEEVKVDKLTADAENLDKNVLGKDEDIANQIKSATAMSQWPMKTQGQKLRDLHMDAMSITEILRLHLASAGAFRSEKLIMWLYQQRGGYRLTDDPGLSFRMEEPQIVEALSSKTVFELSVSEKLKVLHCLMYQILSFASIRDVIDDRFAEMGEAKVELRAHQIAENKRQKAVEEEEKKKRKEMRLQKKEDDLKAQEEKKEESKPPKKEDLLPDAHLTERQRLAIQSQKEKEEQKKQRDEEIKRDRAMDEEQRLVDRVAEMQNACGITFLGRDRAYRRFWALETLPGLFVEHDDDTVGPCLPEPTRFDPEAGPLDEDAAMKKVAEILSARERESSVAKSPDEKGSSDKENDENTKVKEVTKTYSKKILGSSTPVSTSSSSSPSSSVLKQKVLLAKNGALDVSSPSATESSSELKQDQSGAEVKVEAKPDIEEIKLEEKPKPSVPSAPWGACLADSVNCPVHSTILPRTYWSYFESPDQLDSLIDSLNPRGIRESELKEKLEGERDRLAKSFRKFSSQVMEKKLNADKKSEEGSSSGGGGSSFAESADLQLRDQILEMEEKIYMGTLGTLKVRDRGVWQKAISEGTYDQGCEALAWGGKSAQDTPFESRLHSAGASRDQVRSFV